MECMSSANNLDGDTPVFTMRSNKSIPFTTLPDGHHSFRASDSNILHVRLLTEASGVAMSMVPT